jgi:hypothetical protein
MTGEDGYPEPRTSGYPPSLRTLPDSRPVVVYGRRGWRCLLGFHAWGEPFDFAEDFGPAMKEAVRRVWGTTILRKCRRCGKHEPAESSDNSRGGLPPRLPPVRLA